MAISGNAVVLYSQELVQHDGRTRETNLCKTAVSPMLFGSTKNERNRSSSADRLGPGDFMID